MDVHHREFADQFRRDADQTPRYGVNNRVRSIENRKAITNLYSPAAPLIEDNGITGTHRDTVLLGHNDHACNILLGHTQGSLRQAHQRTGSSTKYGHDYSPHAREETA